MSESPDEPLDRSNLRGQPVFFARAMGILEGTLPPRFEGLVGAQCLGIFRPLEIAVEKGVARVGAVTVTAGGRCQFPKPKTVGIGEWLAVRMVNPSDEPADFRLSLLGHCGEPHDPEQPVRTGALAKAALVIPPGRFVETFELQREQTADSRQQTAQKLGSSEAPNPELCAVGCELPAVTETESVSSKRSE